MSLQAKFGYPTVAAAALVGVLRQTQRWLPRYEWVNAHQLGYYIAGINLATVIVGIAGVFALGVRVDRELGHRWTLADVLPTALVAAVGGFAVGTTLAVAFQPGAATSSFWFLGPMAVYTVTEGVPIGLAGVAGLAVGRIHAIERTEAAMAAQSTDGGSTEPHHEVEPTKPTKPTKPARSTESAGANGAAGSSGSSDSSAADSEPAHQPTDVDTRRRPRFEP